MTRKEDESKFAFVLFYHFFFFFPAKKSFTGEAGAAALNNVLHLGLAVVCMAVIVTSKYDPFIYFRF